MNGGGGELKVVQALGEPDVLRIRRIERSLRECMLDENLFFTVALRTADSPLDQLTRGKGDAECCGPAEVRKHHERVAALPVRGDIC